MFIALAELTRLSGFKARKLCPSVRLGVASSLPLDTDLPCLPVVPPVVPACANAASGVACNAIPKARMTRPISADPSVDPHGLLQPWLSGYRAVVRSAPSAQTAPTIRHDRPRLPQSARAASFACCMDWRATIAQLNSEWANAPHSLPEKLISARPCA